MAEDLLATACPICKKPVAVPARGASREELGVYPFCSDRCKVIDLGRWLDGAYQIPVKDSSDDEEKDGVAEM